MSNHTPGPWFISVADSPELGPVGAVSTEEGKSVCPICIVDTLPWIEESRSNARLIAAAPDLLESLVDLVALYPLDSTDAIITSARAAIAKATGGTT